MNQIGNWDIFYAQIQSFYPKKSIVRLKNNSCWNAMFARNYENTDELLSDLQEYIHFENRRQQRFGHSTIVNEQHDNNKTMLSQNRRKPPRHTHNCGRKHR
nr:unnamed protein product [Callosobruchus analis]